MSGSPCIRSVLTNNAIKTQHALIVAMFKAHREDRSEYARSTARILLGNASLPMLHRARANMLLGCFIGRDFRDIAKEPVRMDEDDLGYSRRVNPGDHERSIVRHCKQVLEEEQVAHEEWVDESKGQGELVRVSYLYIEALADLINTFEREATPADD